MLTRAAVFWLVMFAMATLSALFAAAYLFGARLSAKTPTILYTAIPGVVLSLLLRLLAYAMLAVEVAPTTINLVSFGGALVLAFLMLLAAPLIRAVAPNKRIEGTREG